MPEKPREKMKWFKETYGLGQNSAGLILGALSGSAGIGRGDSSDSELVDQLFVPFYRDRLFAMSKPHKGQLHIALALPDTLEYAQLDSAKATRRIRPNYTEDIDYLA